MIGLSIPSFRSLFLCLIVALGIVFHALILFLPPGFNADAATEALRCLDALKGRGGLGFIDFHGYYVSLVSLLPLGIPFSLWGPQVFPVRLLMLFYDLLAVWGIWSLGRRWISPEGGTFVLLLALYSPWLAQPFSVNVATAVAVPVAGIALAETGERRRVLLGHLMLGWSFYAYHTARLCALLYLVLLFILRWNSLKDRVVPLILTACAILPATVMGTLFPSHRKLFLLPRGTVPLSNLGSRLREGFLGWGPEGIACAALSLGALLGMVLWCRTAWRSREPRLACLWVLLSCCSLLAAMYVAPYMRPRVVVHAAPALILACGYLLARVQRTWTLVSWAWLGLICLHGVFLHAFRLRWEGSTARGGWDQGMVEAYRAIRELDADWIHVDCRMDDQLLFFSDRSLPMEDAVFPRTAGATYPWLGYSVKDGASIYLFWADSPEKNHFRQLFPNERTRDVIMDHKGNRQVEIYLVEHDWSLLQRRVLERAGQSALTQEAEFWLGQDDPLKAAALYREILDRFPQSEEAPVAGLKAGLCLLQMGRLDPGFEILSRVVESYPDTREAWTARQVLDRVKGAASN